VISAVNARGAFWAVTYDGKLNAESFIVFLEDFMKGRTEKVFLVIDGHPAHTAKAVERYVKSLGGRLELHRLPTYAPDLNPDEFLWSHMKTNGVSKKPLKQNESLRNRVEEDLLQIKANPELVRSFFCAPSVVYAID
jgi:transposase